MIVIDASVLANAMIGDGHVRSVALRALEDDASWAAPEHLAAEVFSVIRGRRLGGRIGEETARRALDAFAEMTITSVPVRDLLGRMWELRHNLSGYDAAYVALAEGLDCTLVTADQRLARADGIRCAVHLLPAA